MSDKSSLIYLEISLISNSIDGQKLPVRAINYYYSTKKTGQIIIMGGWY